MWINEDILDTVHGILLRENNQTSSPETAQLLARYIITTYLTLKSRKVQGSIRNKIFTTLFPQSDADRSSRAKTQGQLGMEWQQTKQKLEHIYGVGSMPKVEEFVRTVTDLLLQGKTTETPEVERMRHWLGIDFVTFEQTFADANIRWKLLGQS